MSTMSTYISELNLNQVIINNFEASGADEMVVVRRFHLQKIVQKKRKILESGNEVCTRNSGKKTKTVETVDSDNARSNLPAGPTLVNKAAVTLQKVTTQNKVTQKS
jgi:hypothetical protein